MFNDVFGELRMKAHFPSLSTFLRAAASASFSDEGGLQLHLACSAYDKGVGLKQLLGVHFPTGTIITSSRVTLLTTVISRVVTVISLNIDFMNKTTLVFIMQPQWILCTWEPPRTWLASFCMPPRGARRAASWQLPQLCLSSESF